MVSPGQAVAPMVRTRKARRRLERRRMSVMQNGLYVSLSAQVALERRLETIADNVANMNTVGFRATGVAFEIGNGAGRRNSRLSYASSGSDFISRRLGGLVKTDNTLDFAVQGDGWFGIETPQGPAYTRDGRAKIDESGTLRTLNGDPILDAGGAPILVDAGAGPLTVSADGMITQNGRQVGAIGLFAIDPTATLRRAENSSVVPDKPVTPILEFTRDGVVQGAVESSNVDPVRGDDPPHRGDARLRRRGGGDLAVRDLASGRDQELWSLA